jgi:hypothetical protein
MEITKKEIEKILGYEITDYKVTKKAYRGKKVSSMTMVVKPKNYSPGDIIVTIKPTK